MKRRLLDDCSGRSPFGFSLLEVLAVAVIIGLVAALAISRLVGASAASRAAADDTNIAHIELQAQRYYRDYGTWPSADLNEMLPPSSYEYFPEGLPASPTPGASYQFDPATQEVSLQTGS